MDRPERLYSTGYALWNCIVAIVPRGGRETSWRNDAPAGGEEQPIDAFMHQAMIAARAQGPKTSAMWSILVIRPS